MNARLNWGSYIVGQGDGPTSPRFALDELIQTRVLNESRIKVAYAEPDESFSAPQIGRSRASLAVIIPHYNFNCLWNDCRLLGEEEESHQMRDTVLMVHERLAGETELLREFDIALRDAWLTLRSI